MENVYPYAWITLVPMLVFSRDPQLDTLMLGNKYYFITNLRKYVF